MLLYSKLKDNTNNYGRNIDQAKLMKKEKILGLLQDTRFLKFRFSDTENDKLLEFLDELEVVLTELSNISSSDTEYISIMKDLLLEKNIVQKLRSYKGETWDL